MNFFCTKKHYDEWTAKRSLDGDEIFCLDIYEALLVAQMLFANPLRQ